MFVRWGWVAVALGTLALGVLLFFTRTAQSCASGGSDSCGATPVDQLGTAVIAVAVSAVVLYSLGRAFRDPD
ncbi:hypothetical protein [Demequina salsinemoris]|uniref:hypothetical protein n=1 Tax=Demequina salsinemoris TaxID=577470 RepID=UPI000785893B|nr:hypothetical protein [Demequina salsinemoris]